MRKLPAFLDRAAARVAIIGFAFFLFYLTIRIVPFAHLNPKLSDQIPLFALFTGVVFGCFIWESRNWWRRGAFWAFTILIAFTHLLSFLNVLLRNQISPGKWAFVMGALLELGLLILLRNWLLRKSDTAEHEIP
ncbi:MAG TPA: hypothetical protein VF126_04225 [Acidobacteriaceae bacterium]